MPSEELYEELKPRMRQKLEILPSDLLGLALGPEKLPGVRVAVDTETSGLRVDEGARISTVSIGWIDWDRKWEKIVTTHQWASGIQTYRDEILVPGEPPAAVVSFAWPFDQGVTGTGKLEDRGQGALWADAENLPLSEWESLLNWLWMVGSHSELSMHHKKFDCHQFEAGVRRWPGLGLNFDELVTWDTQNGNDLLFGWLPTTSLKGKGSASEHLWGEAESDEKKVISDYLKKHKLPKGRWDLMPWEVIARYADQDARLTARLDHYQMKKIIELSMDPKPGWLDGKDGRMTIGEAAQRRHELTSMLYRMERRGLPFHVDGARAAAKEVQFRARRRAELLPFRPATLATAKHYWFGSGTVKGVEGHGYPPISTTPTGAPSLTADDVTKLEKAGLPGAVHWRDFMKLSRADSMWYTGYADKAGPDGRLRTSVRQNGTRSGRFSVEGIQLQAIPHDYRLSNFDILEGIKTPRQLIGDAVPKGWQLWELDLANAEARVAALFAQCVYMLELISQGKDLHGETAIQLFNVAKEDEEWGEKRSVAKRANFSLIFGVGWETLQEAVESQTGIHMSDHETQVLVTKWRKLYPEYGKAIDEAMEVVGKRQKSHREPGGYITTFNGERRWFTKTEDTHKAFNQRVQSSLGQFAIEWWMEADRYVSKQLTEEELEVGGIVLTIHDSTVLLLPEDRAAGIVAEVQAIGVRLWEQIFPGVPGGVDAKLWGAKD